ncbi:MAG: tetratricopeptide repeat protein [Phycisphaerae bacterium]|nr:tetratricopeptide repeat protein [Phycisphaerae bacterium]
MLKPAKNRTILAMLAALMLGLSSCDSRTDREKALDCLLEEDNARAIVLFTKIIKADPGNYDDYSNRGNAYVGLKQYDKALDDFDKAIELFPDDPEVYSSRGLTYLYTKEYDKALADCNKALALDPKDMLTYHFRAKVYDALGKDLLAKADRDKAAELLGN